MFRVIKLSAIFFSFILLNGCASSCGSSSTESNSSNKSNTNIIVPKRVDKPNSQKNTNANTNLVPYNGAKNINAKNPTLDKSKVKVIDTTKTKAEPMKKKLPDNSEGSVSMNKDGSFVEKREFKNHPQLLKLEKIIKSGKDIKFKVYLKNGKVLDVPEGKIKNLQNDSAKSILEAVGIEAVNTRQRGTKKAEN